MSKNSRKRVAEKAAQFMIEGEEQEYLDAKDRAIMMLGLSSDSRPSNRKIKDYIALLTREQLGDEEVKRRISSMRRIALAVMEALSDFDPFLIGSTLSGKIRKTSDIDIHAYCDDHESLVSRLNLCGYEEVDVDLVENMKGTFIHLKWDEEGYPVEITVYPWSWREVVPISSVTGKAMKRLDLVGLRNLLAHKSQFA